MLFLALCLPLPIYAEEYTFDISEIEKKPYHIGGYAEFKPVFFGLDKKASLYKLKFYNRDEGSTLEEFDAALQLEGSLEKGIARLFIKTNTDYKKSYLGEDNQTTIYEGLQVKEATQNRFIQIIDLLKDKNRTVFSLVLYLKYGSIIPFSVFRGGYLFSLLIAII